MVAGANAVLRRIPPWTLYLGTALYIAWRFWQGLNGALGPDPVNELEHLYGKAALWLLVIGLAITPLRRFVGLNLLRLRRSLGLSAFALVVAHVAVWALLDLQDPALLWADLAKRPFVTVGGLAALLLLPLAATSNDRSIRRLGRRWGRLHRLVYPALILTALHYLWLSKGFRIEPLVWTAVIAGLLILRIRPGRWLPRPHRESPQG